MNRGIHPALFFAEEPGLMGTFFPLSENGSFMPVGVFAPCQKNNR
ncbi:hypothetical protein [Escherichia coli]|nr:hypothetical protein [Escherichia coli]GDI88775.1 hypothetical protein BvCmsKSNP033_02542 [Escherichia coli]